MPTVTLPDGSQAEATPVDFEAVDVSWDEYELADGSTLNTELTMTGVLRLEDQYDGMGNPVYVTQTENQIRTLNVDEALTADTIESDGTATTSDRGVQ